MLNCTISCDFATQAKLQANASLRDWVTVQTWLPQAIKSLQLLVKALRHHLKPLWSSSISRPSSGVLPYPTYTVFYTHEFTLVS